MYYGRFTNQAQLFVVTKEHGFVETSTFANISQGTKQFEFYPLADLFAEKGDLASLEKVLALPDSVRFFTKDAIINAAACGYLEVVQWLVALNVRQWSLVAAASSAARNGHLPIVQWLLQFPETQQSFLLHQAIGAGQLETSRWLWHRVLPSSGALPQSYPLCQAAGLSTNPAMLAFVHEECGVKFSSFAVASMGANFTRQHAEVVCGKVPASRVDKRTSLLTRVASSGTFGAVTYMVDECHLWSRDLLLKAASSTRYAYDEVRFVLDRATSRTQERQVALAECLDLNLQNMFSHVLAGGFDVAMHVLKHTPATDSVSAFDSPNARKSASHPDYIPHTKDDLITRAPRVIASAAQIHAFVGAFIEYRPAASLAIKWLPQLVVRINSVASFERLEEMGHPEIYNDETRACIIKCSRNPRFMVRLLAGAPTPLCEPTTVQWAAQYALIPVLSVLRRQALCLARDEQRQFLQAVAQKAAAVGHVHVLEWVSRSGCEKLEAEPSTVVVDENHSTPSPPNVVR